MMKNTITNLGSLLRGRNVLCLLMVAVVCWGSSGCATKKTSASSADSSTASSRTTAISIPQGPLADHKRLVIFPLDFSVYETSAGEVTEKIPDWSEQAKRHLHQALLTEVGLHGDLKAVPLSIERLSPEQMEQVKEQQALFLAVSNSVGPHVKGMGNAHFPERKFQDYTFGTGLASLVPEADAVVFLAGVDQVSTGGRVAKQVVTGVFLAVLGVVAVPTGGVTAGSIGVVDVKTGTLLWWNTMARRGGMDTREPDGATALVKQLTQGFPWP